MRELNAFVVDGFAWRVAARFAAPPQARTRILTTTTDGSDPHGRIRVRVVLRGALSTCSGPLRGFARTSTVTVAVICFCGSRARSRLYDA